MIYSKYGTDIKEMEEARYLAKRNMESLGNNIRRIRKQLGLTQEELALHVGVTPQAVSRWENGTGMPDISLVVPLAKTLRVSTDALFGVNEDQYDSRVYIDLKRTIEEIEAEAENQEEAALAKCQFMLKKVYEDPDNYIYSVYYVEQVANLSRFVHFNHFAVERWPEFRELAIKYGSNAIRFADDKEWNERAHFALAWIYIHDGNYAYAKEHIDQLPTIKSNRLQESIMAQLALFENGFDAMDQVLTMNLKNFVRAVNKENLYAVQSYAWGQPEKAVSHGQWALSLMETFCKKKELKLYCRGFMRDIYKFIIFALIRLDQIDEAKKYFDELKEQMEIMYAYHQEVLESTEEREKYNERAIGHMEAYTREFMAQQLQEIIDFVIGCNMDNNGQKFADAL